MLLMKRAFVVDRPFMPQSSVQFHSAHFLKNLWPVGVCDKVAAVFPMCNHQAVFAAGHVSSMCCRRFEKSQSTEIDINTE